MDINILEYLFKISKEVKSPLIYIKGNDLYGVDEQFVYLKHTKIDNIYNINILFVSKDMNVFLKNVDLNEIKFVGQNILYSSFDNTVEINNMDMIMNIERMILSINNMISYCPNKLVIDNVREIQEFEDIMSYKTAEGAGIFRYQHYVMSIYNNLIPVKKADKLELVIYDLDRRTFLSNFNIKRKKQIIEVYIMYLHM